MKRNGVNGDEIGVVGVVHAGSHIAKNLIAPLVAHGLRFGDLLGVLQLAHGRVVFGDLTHPVRLDHVEPGIAHVADGHAVALQNRDRKNAGHALPLRPGSGGFEDRVIR